MASELERDEARRAHRADEVGRVLIDRRQTSDAAFGQVLEDDVRGLQAVLVAGELIVWDLDERWISERGRVLAVVIVVPALERERTRHEVAGLVAAAGGELDLKRSRGNPGGGERCALIVSRPLEVGDLRADRDLDGRRFHRVVEVELQRGAGVDLHAIGQRPRWTNDRDDMGNDDRGEGPGAALDAVTADVVDRLHAHRVGGQLIERLGR